MNRFCLIIFLALSCATTSMAAPDPIQKKLIACVKDGEVNAVRRLLASDDTVDVDWSLPKGKDRGKSAIYWAAFNGDFQMLGLLLERFPRARADFEPQEGTYKGLNAVWFACDAARKHTDTPWFNLIRIMLRNHPSLTLNVLPTAEAYEGKTILWYLGLEFANALRFEQWDDVNLLLRFKGIDLSKIAASLFQRDDAYFFKADWRSQPTAIPPPLVKAMLLYRLEGSLHDAQRRNFSNLTIDLIRVRLEALLAKIAEIFLDADAIPTAGNPILLRILNRDVILQMALVALRTEDPELAGIEPMVLRRALVAFASPELMRLRRAARVITAAVMQERYPITRRDPATRDVHRVRHLRLQDDVYRALHRIYAGNPDAAVFTENFRARAVAFVVHAPEGNHGKVWEALLQALQNEPVPPPPPLDTVDAAEPEVKRPRVENTDMIPVVFDEAEIEAVEQAEIIDFGMQPMWFNAFN